ncbi:MAG: hypothetical protein MJ233_04280 [Mycoplasmoidaceae bacterium]|nr:hypothetical protein [Mycoplasmoidaceae bacterium]
MVDKLMYAYMGNHNTANGIKYNTYDYYLAKAFDSKVDKYNFQTIKATPEFKNAQNSIYIGSKLLTGDKNFASYASSPTGVDFYTTMANAFEQKINDDELQTGQNINDTNLDECAF